MEHNNNYAQIDLDILKENMAHIKAHVKVPVLLVVKADAYGHGAVPIAKCLEQDCAMLGVAAFSEAMELRRNGITKPILMLGHTPPSCFPEAIRQGVRPALFQYEDALAYSCEAQKLGIEAPFHLAVDTGLSRIGFQVTQEDADICKKIVSLPNLKLEGLFTHYSNADDEDQARTQGQTDKYEQFCKMLADRGIEIPIRHTENSAALTNFDSHYDMVRAGIVVYGMHASHDVKEENVNVRPCLSWYSHVTFVKPLEEGRVISYGATHTVDRPSVVATVAVGYADGYRRHLLHKFHVLINGQKAKVLGKICMDQIIVDVTDIPNVKQGDRVTLIGQDGNQLITADEMAETAGTINYDITCGLSRRVPRVYTQGGKIVQVVDHLAE